MQFAPALDRIPAQKCLLIRPLLARFLTRQDDKELTLGVPKRQASVRVRAKDKGSSRHRCCCHGTDETRSMVRRSLSLESWGARTFVRVRWVRTARRGVFKRGVEEASLPLDACLLATHSFAFWGPCCFYDPMDPTSVNSLWSRLPKYPRAPR